MTDVSPELLDRATGDAELQRLVELSQHLLYTFRPRPDRPEQFDEQTGFVESQSVVSVALGGNASGKTTAGAYKAARFMLQQQQPSRKDEPFWVVSGSLYMVSEICWRQGLQRFIPREYIDEEGPRCPQCLETGFNCVCYIGRWTNIFALVVVLVASASWYFWG